MKTLMMAGMAACLATVAWAEPVNEPVDNPNIRFSANGFGRIGQKLRGEMGSGMKNERGEIWGANFDLQYNFLSNDKFNLWTGLGFGYAPKQHFASLSDSFYDSDVYGWSRESVSAKVKLETYDLRFLMVPEYQLTDSFAFGLRLGLGMSWCRAELSENWSYVDSYGTNDHESDKYHEKDYVLYGLVGVQATWNFAANMSLFAYCDARFSDDVEFKDGGEKYGEIEASSLDVGVGLSVAF